MKYYYTDALAASWMADKFGMKLKTPRGQNMYYDGRSFRTEKDCGVYGGGKHYIHHDSLHILYPQLGDVVHTAGMHPYKEIVIVELRDYLKRSGGFKIIQRKGMAFIWPEKEDAVAP